MQGSGTDDYYAAAMKSPGVGGLALRQILDPSERLDRLSRCYVLSAPGREDVFVPFWQSAVVLWRRLMKWRHVGY